MTIERKEVYRQEERRGESKQVYDEGGCQIPSGKWLLCCLLLIYFCVYSFDSSQLRCQQDVLPTL